MALSLGDLDRARRDPAYFAEVILGEPLWPHQREVVASAARYRVLCAGRRAGKTRVFGVLALWTMFRQPGARVLLVSAGRTSVVRTHKEIAAMARGPVAGSSVEDDQVMTLTLSNGSTLESVTQSVNAVRSADVDLLIVDEAGFVDQLVWDSAEPTVGARPGSRVLVSSSPWRGPGHFFHDLWRQGMERPDEEVRSWHWPSTASPLVDRKWLRGVKERTPADTFEREYEAKWTDEAGAYFSTADLAAASAPYDLLSPAALRKERLFAPRRRFPAVVGVDWGMARDQNALAVVSVLEDEGLNGNPGDWRFFVPWLDARHRWAWADFIEELVGIARAYDVHTFASETNGVGAYPTDDLRTKVQAASRRGELPYWSVVSPVWTDARRKQSGFGMMRMLLQTGRLVLPQDPELLKQLRALEFEQRPGGTMSIAVPERSGHDDLAMALCQAVSCLSPQTDAQGPRPVGAGGGGNPLELTAGFRMPNRPWPADYVGWALSRPKGREKGEVW